MAGNAKPAGEVGGLAYGHMTKSEQGNYTMRTATSTKSLQQYYARMEAEDKFRKAEDERMHKALAPLVDLWGVDKYNEWVDQFVTDEMTVDEIIDLANQFYPECTCTPELQPCPGCREWARARARIAGAMEDELPYEE